MEEKKIRKGNQRAGSEASMGHVVPEGVLAATTLVGSWAGSGGARVRARCETGVVGCSLAVALYPGCW